MENQANPIPVKKKQIPPFLLYFFSFLIALGVGAFLVAFLNTISNTFFAISLNVDPTGYVAIILVLFIFAIALKINYSSRIFIADLLLSVLVVGFAPFTDALFFILIFVLLQKLFKII